MFVTWNRLVSSAVLLAVASGSAWADSVSPVPCPYATAHDAPLDASESVVADATDHTQLRVEFNGIQGDRVPGFLYVPKDADGKRPAVLLQYGTGGNKNTNYIVALGQAFVAHGFVVLTIDAPRRGERAPKEKKNTYWFHSTEGRDLFLEYLGDYSRAVDYLATRPEVDAERIGYAGISWGAITGVTYVAHDPRIKAMASMVGGGNFLGLLSGDLPENVRRIWSEIDPVFHVPRIAPRPLLMLNVTRDLLVPRFFAESLHKAAGEGATVIWLEADHTFKGVDREAVAQMVIEFLAENL